MGLSGADLAAIQTLAARSESARPRFPHHESDTGDGRLTEPSAQPSGGPTARDGSSRTDPSMPNAAPPRTRPGRTRSSTALPDASTPSVPALWTGLGDLVATMTERSPADALTIATVAEGLTDAGGGVQLRSLWDAPVAAAGARARYLIRTLDAGGRLSLPLTFDGATTLHAEHLRNVLTVYLPQAKPRTASKRTGATVGLRGGRLTLAAALRAQLGIADRADILVLFDSDAATLTLTAAAASTRPSLTPSPRWRAPPSTPRSPRPTRLPPAPHICGLPPRPQLRTRTSHEHTERPPHAREHAGAARSSRAQPAAG